MYNRLIAFYNLLSCEQKKRLLRLQILVVLMAFAEIGGVVAIGPFMTLVGDMSRLEGEGVLAHLYEISGFTEQKDFLFYIGISVILALSMGAIVSMITTWRLALYANQVGAELGTRLYKHYMSQPWLFHANSSSSQLTNKISQECSRVTSTIIRPFMIMNAKVVLAFFMVILIFVYNPVVATTGLIIFLLAYFMLYQIVRRRLVYNGSNISEANQQRFKLMNEGFGGIKDTLLLGRQKDFNQRFEKASQQFGRAQGTTQALSVVPRYVMELIAFGSVIFLLLYLLSDNNENLGDILPVLAIYALAGFKLLPAFQQMYTSITLIRGNLAAFDNLEADLRNSSNENYVFYSEAVGKLQPQKEIRLEKVFFSYPGKEEPALKGVDLRLPVNHVIGLVGASGSGKSTTIDILLGLINPQKGSLIIDGQPLQQKQLRAWQNSLGFVPQTIFLADATIRENIAFGLPYDQIDEKKVLHAAKMAHLDELLRELPRGLDTRVGERGIQLSGGQRQRIGIARALYDDADVLIMDEATSALDGITEKLVMDAIHDFSGQKTIIMIAHRLSTVRKCDCIYLMDHGTVLDYGTYEDLKKRNSIFKKMTIHA